MYDYTWKKWGLVVSALGLLGMIMERLERVIIVTKFSVPQHYALFELIMLFGLLIVIFCKEKEEDDRARAIRSKSFQFSFTLVISALLVFAFITSVDTHTPLLSADLFYLVAIGIVFYLLFFNVGLYFDFLWDYEDKGVWENLKNVNKNKWSLLIYLISCAIIFILLNLL